MNTSISPKLKMILSIIFFLLSLLLLWTALPFSMPTQMLAIRKAEAQLCLDREDWVTTEHLKGLTFSNGGDWHLSRRGDDFYVALPIREGAFWSMAYLRRLSHLGPYYVTTSSINENGNHVWIYHLLVTTPNPDTARVELVQDGQIVDCVETAPGSGFWLGEMRSSEDGSVSPLARAYDADGNLIASTPP